MMKLEPNKRSFVQSRTELNSPPTPLLSFSVPPGREFRVESYQLKVTCPVCSTEGYSGFNVIRKDIMKSFPLCWTEGCFNCQSEFSVNNGIPDVCRPCRNKLECLERGVVEVELIESF